jgi:mRNA interferase MazF
VSYPSRQEVWLVDLRPDGKIRPCVVINTAISHIDRAIMTIVPHTTAVRGTAYESPSEVFFLRPGAFNGQGIITVSVRRAIRILGVLTTEQMQQVERVVCKWLDLPCHR